MKKILTGVVICAFIMMTGIFNRASAAHAVAATPATKSVQPTPSKTFYQVYQEALQLNAKRFKNLNAIQIGDTILFPARNSSNSGSGPLEYWVADSASKTGKHDCIWNMTSRYMDGQIITNPVKPAPKAATPKAVKKAVKSDKAFYVGLLILLAILALFILAIWLNNLRIKRKMNQSKYPAMFPNGLHDDARTTTQKLLNSSNYGQTMQSVNKKEDLWLTRVKGPKSITVNMLFADGIKRDVIMRPGDGVIRITYTDHRGIRIINHYSAKNGNYFDFLSMPKNWALTTGGVIDNPLALPTEQPPANHKAERVQNLKKIVDKIEENNKTVMDMSTEIRTAAIIKDVAAIPGLQEFSLVIGGPKKISVKIGAQPKK